MDGRRRPGANAVRLSGRRNLRHHIRIRQRAIFHRQHLRPLAAPIGGIDTQLQGDRRLVPHQPFLDDDAVADQAISHRAGRNRSAGRGAEHPIATVMHG